MTADHVVADGAIEAADAAGRRATIGHLHAAARERLREAGVPSPAADARQLLLHVLGWAPHDLVLRSDNNMSPTHRAELEAALGRRTARVPLQQITGSSGFRRVELAMQVGVFIPRPETELLIDLVLPHLPPDGVVVEPCTGSGAIAAAIADERPDARIIATDLDPAAAALARRNTRGHADRVSVHVGDLLEPVDDTLRRGIDVLAANPPYLAEDELDQLEPEVLRGDPHRALVAGPTGHEISDRLIDLAVRWLAPRGALVLELDPRRVSEVAQRCAAAGLVDVEQVDDLTGTARFVRAFRAED